MLLIHCTDYVSIYFWCFPRLSKCQCCHWVGNLSNFRRERTLGTLTVVTYATWLKMYQNLLRLLQNPSKTAERLQLWSPALGSGPKWSHVNYLWTEETQLLVHDVAKMWPFPNSRKTDLKRKEKRKEKKKWSEEHNGAGVSSVSVLYGSGRVIQYQEPSFLNMTQGAGIGVYTIILGKEESLISAAPQLHVCLDIITVGAGHHKNTNHIVKTLTFSSRSKEWTKASTLAHLMCQPHASMPIASRLFIPPRHMCLVPWKSWGASPPVKSVGSSIPGSMQWNQARMGRSCKGL